LEVCHSGCSGICEEGECEIKVELGKELSTREMAALIIELLGSEEITVVNPPKGRLLLALLEVAKWMGIEVRGAKS
jgi:hypothetical protein